MASSILYDPDLNIVHSKMKMRPRNEKKKWKEWNGDWGFEQKQKEVA